MLRFYDYRCLKCQSTRELLVENTLPHEAFPCKCGGVASKVWVAGPVVGSPAKGRYPYYDVQLGRSFESPSEKKTYLKEKGMIEISREEHKRTLDTMHEPEETYIDKEKWRDCAERAWADIQSGNVPLAPARSIAEADCDMVAFQESV